MSHSFPKHSSIDEPAHCLKTSQLESDGAAITDVAKCAEEIETISQSSDQIGRSTTAQLESQSSVQSTDILGGDEPAAETDNFCSYTMLTLVATCYLFIISAPHLAALLVTVSQQTPAVTITR